MSNPIKLFIVAYLSCFSFFYFLGLNSPKLVVAQNNNKIDWCHCEPNSNCQSLNLPPNALQQAGHMDASGNPLHFNDHAGVCTCSELENCPISTPTLAPTSIPTPTQVPTSAPTQTPSLTPVPTPTTGLENTPTPTIDPENTPTQVPTSAPTQTPSLTPVPTSTVSSGNNGNSNNSSNNNNSGAPVCNDQDPGTPSSLRVVALGGGKVQLIWDNAPGPHTSYAIAYGPSVGNYLYGNPNVGNVTTYTVSALNPGGKYCFYVQAQNGCRGGSPSNVVCTNQGAGSVQVLGATSNYNPLVDGISNSYGGSVLGDSTELVAAGETVFSDEKLPSGNILADNQSIFIPSIGVGQPIYLPQKVGDILTVGHNEVLSTMINNVEVYYGHNGRGVFKSLYKVKNGDKVTILKNNQELNYRVVTKEIVSKYAVEAVNVNNPGDIILVTCSAAQPKYRILVKASLIK